MRLFQIQKLREHKIIKISQIINFEIKSLSEEIKPIFKHMLENMKFGTWNKKWNFVKFDRFNA